MNKTTKLFIISILTSTVLLTLPKLTQAANEIKIDISNNGEGSNNSVSVNSSSSFSSSSQSSSNTQTDIRIESNGEVKEYHSNKPENIDIQSTDGKSKVTITNQTNSSTSPSPSPSETATPSAQVKAFTEGKFDLFEFLRQLFTNLF